MQVNFHLKSVNDNKWLTKKAALFWSENKEIQRDDLSKETTWPLGRWGSYWRINSIPCNFWGWGEETFPVRPTDDNIPYKIHHLHVTRSKFSFQDRFTPASGVYTLGWSHRSFHLKKMKCTLAKVCLILSCTGTLTLSYLLLLRRHSWFELYIHHIHFFPHTVRRPSIECSQVIERGFLSDFIEAHIHRMKSNSKIISKRAFIRMNIISKFWSCNEYVKNWYIVNIH